MSSIPPTPPNPPPVHYPHWAVTLIAPANQDEAIASFLTMARTDSNSTDVNPRMRVVNPFGGKGVLWLSFDLKDPAPDVNEEGDQDHTLFKGPNDTDGREKKGRRLASEYMPDRAARIPFIAKTLKDPNVHVYRCESKPRRLVFTVRTGPDEHFLVFVNELQCESPRFSYVTAYYVTDQKFKRLQLEEWTRLHPKANKPPKKGKKRR